MVTTHSKQLSITPVRLVTMSASGYSLSEELSPSLPPSLPHSLTHSPTPFLPPSLPPSLPYSLTYSLTHSLTHSLTLPPIPLHSAHAHPSLPDNDSWLPLHHACDGEHLECVRAILGHQGGLRGLTSALSLARERGNSDIITLLQEAASRWVECAVSCDLSHDWSHACADGRLR